MQIEKEIFKGYQVKTEKLLTYGFSKEKDTYIFTKKIVHDTFQVTIEIKSNGTVKGKIMDLTFNEEYTNYRISWQTGEFVNQIRRIFEDILLDIRTKCYKRQYFKTEQANRIAKAIASKYGDIPEFPWDKGVEAGVFRNADTKKWYGLIMHIDKSKITKESGNVDVLNVKLKENEILELLKKKGFYKAYHMNKKSWITILLDDTLCDEEIMRYVDESYEYTEKKSVWIIPANPKYYDVIHCFNNTDTILWKQSNRIKKGDIIYIYVGSPYSAILYKCEVLEADIPYTYQDKNLSIEKGMRIKLCKRYEKDAYPFEVLKKFGVKAVRGPRSMPSSLRDKIEKD